MMNAGNLKGKTRQTSDWRRRMIAFVSALTLLISSCGLTAFAETDEDIYSDPVTAPIPAANTSPEPEEGEAQATPAPEGQPETGTEPQETTGEETETEEEPEVSEEPEDLTVYEPGTLTAEADGIGITVDYTAEARVPEGTVLTLTRAAGGDLYSALKSASKVLKTEENETWKRELGEDAVFYAITLTDSEGNEVHPETGVTLTCTNLEIPANATGFVTGENAENLDWKDTLTVGFLPDAIGYAYLKQVQIGTVTLTHNDRDYMVTAAYGPDAGFPANTELKVREILPGTPEYALYSGMTDEALNEDWAEITLERYFDIAFVANGEELEPKADVDVQIVFRDKIEQNEETEVAAVHIENNEANVIEADTDSTKSARHDDEAIDTVTFTSDSFSVYGVVQKKKIITKVLAADGNTYEIEISYTQEAEIPEESQVKVEEIPEGSDLWEAYRKQTAAALNADDVRLPGLYDISIIDAEGARIEPKAPVSVSIKLANAEANNEDLHVVHFTEEIPQELVEAEAKPEEQTEGQTEEQTTAQSAALAEEDKIASEKITANVEDNTVTFETQSFSVYAFAYTVDFHYKGVDYSIEGNSQILLSELISILGIQDEEGNLIDVMNVNSIDFSNEHLVSVQQVSGIIHYNGKENVDVGEKDFLLSSLEPFSTDEELTIHLTDGTDIAFHVTDAQQVKVTYEIDKGRVWIDANESKYQQDSNANTKKYGYGYSDSYLIESGNVPSAVTANLTAGGKFIAWFDDTGAIVSVNTRFVPTKAVNRNTTYHAQIVESDEYPDYPNYITFTVDDPNKGKIVLSSDNTDTKGRFFPYTVSGNHIMFYSNQVTAIPSAGYVLDYWDYNGQVRWVDGSPDTPNVREFWVDNEYNTSGTTVQVVTAHFKKSDSNGISISYDLDVIPYVGNQPEYLQRWVDTQVSVVRGGDSFLNFGGNVYGESYSYGTAFNLPNVSQQTRVTQTTDGYNLLTLSFLGWRPKGSTIIYPAGTQLHAFVSTTFEAVWDAYFPGKEGYYGHGDKKHRFNTNTVGFFVRIVDDVFDVGNKGLYTECLYTTKLYLSGSGDFATNSGTNGTRHDFYGNGNADEINLLGSIDKALRANATSGLSYSGTSFSNAQGYQSQYNGAVIKLASFPSDSYIFNQLKAWNTSGRITVQGQQVSNDLLNSDHFEIRWYVLKDQENQWHVDGMLIPKVTLKTDVVVKKVWEDDDADHSQDSVTVSLIRYKKGASSSGDPDIPSGYGEDTTLDTATLDSSSSWQKKYEDLELYDSNGNIYYYGIKEIVVPSGYNVSYSPSRVVVATNSEITLTATNTKEIPNSKELTVSKEWYYGNTSGEPLTALNSSRYNETFTIYQTTTNFDSSVVNSRDVTVDSNANTTTITGETTVHPGDVLELTIPNEFWIGVDWSEQGAGWRNNAATLTRTKIRDCVYQVTVPVNASALHIGQWTYSGQKPEVNVRVIRHANAKLFTNAVMSEMAGGAVYSETITLPNNGSWSKTIEVPAKDEQGNPYYYYVIESNASHDTAYEYDEATNSWLVKNVEDVVVEYGKIRIQKQVINIEDNNAIETEQTFAFNVKDVSGNTVGDTLNVTTSAPAETGDLDFGTYYIEETGTAPEIAGFEFDSYEITIGSEAADAISVNSTETVVVTAKNYYRPVVEDLNIDVVKTWSGEGAKPESITVVLQKKVGTEGAWVDTDKSINLTAVNSWSGQFTELDKTEEEQTVYYRVREVGVGGWTTSYSNNEGISATSANKTISITNTRSGIPTNDKTKVLVQKKWVVNSETVSNPPDTDAVQVKLTRYKAEATAENVTIHFYKQANDGYVSTWLSDVSTSASLPLTLTFNNPSGTSFNADIYVHDSATPLSGQWNWNRNQKEVKKISQTALSATIDGSYSELWLVITDGWAQSGTPESLITSVSVNGSSAPVVASGGSNEYVFDDYLETVSLNSSNSWQYEFNNLPKSGTENGTNYSYKYAVIETNYGTGSVETEYSTDGGTTWISEAGWKATGEDYPDLSNASADTQTVIIRNTKVETSGKLVIHKTWNGVPDGTDVSGLSFTVTGPNDYSQVIPYSEFDQDTQSIEIGELTPGTYHVMETNADTLISEYQLVAGESTTEGSANVVNNATATVELTNSYQQIAFGSITLEKTIRGENAGENEDNTFSFTITILDEDGETDTSFNGTYDNSETAVTGASFENGVATVDLTVGTPLSISGLLEGTRFRIEEVENPAYEIGTIMETDSNTMLPVVITDRPVAGTVAGDTIIIYSIENIHTVGNLTVSKTVEDEEPDTDKKFGFTVTIVNASGETDTGFEGTYGSMTFIGGVATFELGDGESATADNLPDGTLYTVVEDEANSNGYVTVFEATTSISGQEANGVIETGETETVAFTNTPVNTVTVTGLKQFIDVDTTFQPKAIKLKLFYITEDGLTQTPVTVDAYGNEIETEKIIYPGSVTTEEQTTTWEQEAEWTDLPAPEEGYRYYVKETELYYGELESGTVPVSATWITAPESIADIFVQEGGIAAFNEPDPGIGRAVVKNRLKKIDVPVEKTWEDFSDEQFSWSATFQLEQMEMKVSGDDASDAIQSYTPVPGKSITISKGQTEGITFDDLLVCRVHSNGSIYRLLYSVKETAYSVSENGVVVNAWDEEHGQTVGTEQYVSHLIHGAGAIGDESNLTAEDPNFYTIILDNRTEDLSDGDKINVNLNKVWPDGVEGKSATFKLQRYYQEGYCEYTENYDSTVNCTLSLDGKTYTVKKGTKVLIVAVFKAGSSGKGNLTILGPDNLRLEYNNTNESNINITWRSSAFEVTGNMTFNLNAGSGITESLVISDLQDVTEWVPDSTWNNQQQGMEVNQSNSWTITRNDLTATSYGQYDESTRRRTERAYSYYFEETATDPANYYAEYTSNGATLGDVSHRIISDASITATNKEKKPFRVTKLWQALLNSDLEAYPEIAFTLYQIPEGKDKVEASDVYRPGGPNDNSFVNIKLNYGNNWTWDCPVQLPETYQQDGQTKYWNYYVIETPKDAGQTVSGVVWTNPAYDAISTSQGSGNDNLQINVEGYRCRDTLDGEWTTGLGHGGYTTQTPGGDAITTIDHTKYDQPYNAAIRNTGEIQIINKTIKYMQMDLKKKFLRVVRNSSNNGWNLETWTQEARVKHDLVIEIQVKRRIVEYDSFIPLNNGVPVGGADYQVVQDWTNYGLPVLIGYGPGTDSQAGTPISENPASNPFKFREADGDWHWTIDNEFQDKGLPAYGLYKDPTTGVTRRVRYQYILVETNAFSDLDRNNPRFWYNVLPAAWDGAGFEVELFPKVVAQDQDRLVNVENTEINIKKEWNGTSGADAVYVKIWRKVNGGDFTDYTNTLQTSISQLWQNKRDGLVNTDDLKIVQENGVTEYYLIIPTNGGEVTIRNALPYDCYHYYSGYEDAIYYYKVQECGYQLNGQDYWDVTPFDPEYGFGSNAVVLPQGGNTIALDVGDPSRNVLKIINTVTADITVEKKWELNGTLQNNPWTVGEDTVTSVEFSVTRVGTKYTRSSAADAWRATGTTSSEALSFTNGAVTENVLRIVAGGKQAKLRINPVNDKNYTVTYEDYSGSWKTFVSGLQLENVVSETEKWVYTYQIAENAIKASHTNEDQTVSEISIDASEYTTEYSVTASDGVLGDEETSVILNNHGTATVTNSRTLKGALSIIKQVTVNGESVAVDELKTDGEPETDGESETGGESVTDGESVTGTSLADGTYTFTVAGPSPSTTVVKYVQIDVVNGVAVSYRIADTEGGLSTASTVPNGTAVVEDLTPGDYTITEEATDNGTTLSGRSGGTEVEERGILLTVEAGCEASAAIATFTNNKPYITYSPKVTKTLTGREWKEGDSFTFTLATTSTSGMTMPVNNTVTISYADDIKTKAFDEVAFTAEDTYTFTITETVPDDASNGTVTWHDASDEQKAAGGFEKDGVTYDGSAHTLTVTVEETSGVLSITHINNEAVADQPAIEAVSTTVTNTYDTSTTAHIEGTKVFTNGTIGENQFSFTVTANDNNTPLPEVTSVYADTNGDIVFGDITYPLNLLDEVEAEEGVKTKVFTYTVKEDLPSGVNPTDADKTAGYIIVNGIKYDLTEKTVTITVMYTESSGEMTASVSPEKVGLEFTNVQYGSVQVRKAFSGIDALPDGFKITANWTIDSQEYSVELTTSTTDSIVEGTGYTVSEVSGDGNTIPYTWTIGNLPIGTEVTFTEDAEGCRVDGYIWSSTVSVNDNEATSGISGTATVDADEIKYVTITNTYVAGVELPSTGGSGTLIYTITGIFLITLAGTLLVARKRKANR